MGNLITPRRASLLTPRVEMMSKLKVYHGSSASKIKKPSVDVDPDRVPSLPLQENRPDVLFPESNAAAVAAGADVDPDLDPPDPEVQAALAEFCKVGNDELSEAEKYAFFSGFDLDVNEVQMNTLYPLSDTSCRQVFAPESAPPAPEPQPEEEYHGPNLVDEFLKDFNDV